MKEYIEERAIKMAEYIIENKTTVRQTAKEFGISKSTVHKDVTNVLRESIRCLPRRRARYLTLISRNAISVGEWQPKKNTHI